MEEEATVYLRVPWAPGLQRRFLEIHQPYAVMSAATAVRAQHDGG